MPASNFQGPVYGEKQPAVGSFETLIDGLTASQMLTIRPLTTNPSAIYVRHKGGAGSGTGYRMEATTAPLTLYIGYDPAMVQVQSVAAGSTISYIGSEGFTR